MGHITLHFAHYDPEIATEVSGIAFGACWLATIFTMWGIFELAKESSKY